MTFYSLQCEVQRIFHKNFHMFWFLRISKSIIDAVHFHGDRSDNTELPGLMFHIRTQVGMMVIKNTNLPDSEVGNNKSIGMRVPNPQFVYTGTSLPKKVRR